MTLLVATGNAGKLAEFRRLLTGIDVCSPQEAGVGDLRVDETGDTFRDNARQKARVYAGASGRVSLADDSGLEVEALGGAPGVRSARYGGDGLDDRGRCERLLAAMEGVPRSRRRARFRCWLVAAAPDGRQVSAQGTCEGWILEAPRGDQGFGYDPVFDAADAGCSMAQLGADEKAAISHRGHALRAIHPLLLQTFPEIVSP